MKAGFRSGKQYNKKPEVVVRQMCSQILNNSGLQTVSKVFDIAALFKLGVPCLFCKSNKNNITARTMILDTAPTVMLVMVSPCESVCHHGKCGPVNTFCSGNYHRGGT